MNVLEALLWPVFHLDRGEGPTSWAKTLFQGQIKAPFTQLHLPVLLASWCAITSLTLNSREWKIIGYLGNNNEEMGKPACLPPVSASWWEVENTCKREAFLALTVRCSDLPPKLFFFPTDQHMSCIGCKMWLIIFKPVSMLLLVILA